MKCKVCGNPTERIYRRWRLTCSKKCFSSIVKENGHRNRTHGLSKLKLYDVHRQMMRRCYDIDCKDFSAYGKRGVQVYDKWHDLPCFIEWANEHGYDEGLTIERRDVNGNYCPENCSWIRNEQQALNTRKVRLIEYNGIIAPISDWATAFNIKSGTIKTRLRLGWSIEETLLTEPVIGRNQHNLI